MVPPIIHRVLTSAGIKDCSATIEGSRNPMQVLKATIQLLHSGVSSVLLNDERNGLMYRRTHLVSEVELEVGVEGKTRERG
jgi:ribosomal protein S5